MRNARQIFYKMGYNTKRWKDIQVPGSWELQGFDAPIYTDTRYPFPPNPPYVPTDYNPVGAYIREFTVPASWEGMDIFLNFEGVESAYYVWVKRRIGRICRRQPPTVALSTSPTC